MKPKKDGETHAWKVEHVAAIVKKNCQALWFPSSYLAVDEAMVSYRGRFVDKVKLPNKLIKEGYKVWILEDSGYVYDWLWHSRVEGPEEVPTKGLQIDRIESIDLTKTTKVQLAPTFALVLRLAQRLRAICPESTLLTHTVNVPAGANTMECSAR